MIVFEKGDLFEVDADIIAHGVNCKGVMGAGIAKAFRAKFPLMHGEYRMLCKADLRVPGNFDWWKEDGVNGLNLFTQDNPGADATTRALRLSLLGVSVKIATHTGHRQTTLAMPLIGCGIGGLTYPEFVGTLRSVARQFPEITYKVVYNSDNEHLVSHNDRVS